MDIIDLPIKAIKPYKNNPRHNDKAVEYVANSIREFGFKQPIVIDDQYEIVCGHTRWKAAKAIGLETVPCVMADDLTPEQIRAYRLADNKTAEMADWDFDLLEQELNEIDPAEFDMADFGFFQDGEEPEKAPAEVTEDDFDESTVTEAVCKRGQVWKLGDHRLMCGDSTSSEDVARLMNGEKADIAFTSPPYNAGFGSNITKDNGRSKYLDGSDNMTQGEYRHFLNEFISNVIDHCDYLFMNIQFLANNKDALVNVLADNLNILADIIIWDKGRSQPQLAVNVLNSEFEFVFCFSKKGNRSIGTIPFHGTLKNIIHISNQRSTEFANIHNATMPVQVAGHFVENFAKDSVIDLFGGTGTTLIACEQLDRRCFMMELDPRYCSVILQRYINYKGSDEDVYLLDGDNKIPYSEITK